MTITKNSIQEKIIEGNTGEAIKVLLKLTYAFDQSLYNETIMLSARHHALEKEISAFQISDENAKLNKNRINYALTQILTRVKDDWKIYQAKEELQAERSENRTTIVLFLAANPRDTRRLRLDEELRKIEEVLNSSKQKGSVRLVQKWAVRIPDLRKALLDEGPNIVHFSGHGSETGRIYLEGEDGDSVEVIPQALGSLFELFKDQVDCVVLNACYSESQAQEISKHIPYVVGMNDKVPDKASIAFSGAFYDAIANGRDIEFAFQLGMNAIQFQDLNDRDLPVLVRKLQ